MIHSRREHTKPSSSRPLNRFELILALLVNGWLIYCLIAALCGA